jgi:hypothetical protein
MRDSWVSGACNNLNNYKTESIWCRIIADKGSELIVDVCYRSPNAENWEIDELFNAIMEASSKHVIIMGDFNYPGINWETMDSDSNCSNFADLVQDCFMVQHVHEPTRQKNTLDLILTSEENMIEDVVVREHLGNSDHNIVTWKLVYKTEINRGDKQLYAFNKADYRGMNEFLQNVQWDEDFKKLDVENMWHKICEVFRIAIKKYVPIRKIKRNRLPVWMTRKAKSRRKYKSMMWERCRESRS